MIDDNNNENEIVELKQANPWLDLFDLTDEEIKSVSILVSRVIIGSDDLDIFYNKLKTKLKRDDQNIKKIFLVIAKNKLLPLGDKVGDVTGFIDRLGGSLPDLPKNNFISSNQKTMKVNIPVNKKTPISISYSQDDADEIKEIISNSNSDDTIPRDYSELVDAIVSELGYNSEDEVLIKRLKNIITFRLKDVRDELETTEALKKSKKIGGLEMDDSQVKRTIDIIASKISQGLASFDLDDKPSTESTISFPAKNPFKEQRINLIAKKDQSAQPIASVQTEIEKIVETVQPTKSVVESPVRPQAKVSDQELPKISEEGGLPVIISPQGDDLMIPPKNLNQNVVPRPTLPAQPISPHSSGDQSVKEPVLAQPIPEVPKKPIPPKPFPQPRLATMSHPKSVRADKPQVDGVRLGSSLVGPVEELGTMTLINFRRLGQTPHEAIAKIGEKIDLLEKDSYAKRLEGIGAWHKNEVTRFYRLLGQESMNSDRSVEDIISERIKENKPTLSIEEFNSVMRLNSQLRY